MIKNLQSYLDTHHDFPKDGVTFFCIARLLREAFPDVIHALANECKHLFRRNDKVLFAGIESRGFLVAAGLAAAMGQGVLLIRKKGKLPGIAIASQDVTLEYGEATLETHYGLGGVVLCDDVVATGGSLLGAEKLLTRAGYDVLGKLCILNLKHLNTIPGDQLISLLQVFH